MSGSFVFYKDLSASLQIPESGKSEPAFPQGKKRFSHKGKILIGKSNGSISTLFLISESFIK